MKKNIQWKNFLNYFVVVILGIIFTVLTMSGGLSTSFRYLLEQITIAAIAAVSLSLVVGFLGELSLGHAGFMCAGAYIGGKVAYLLAENTGLGNSLITMIIALVVGAIVAAVLGLVIGLPALRLKGDYLAIVTLAFGEIVKFIFMNSDKKTFGGALGLDTPRFNSKYLFIVGFVLILITLAVVQNLMRSKHGRAITAIRDNEIAARATGINVTKYKLIVFMISSMFAGMAGVLYSYANYTIQSSKFDYNYSIEILVMVVLGGMGSINGSMIAATIITVLNVELATILTGNLAVLQRLVYSLILILLVIYNNAPAFKNFREKNNFRALAGRLRPHNPSRIDNDEGQWARIPTKIKMDEILSTDFAKVDSFSPDKPDKPEGGH
ncbi:MAG: branched-chain amino acid ABC transporter permease [Lachnospiraceae bacterium]|nr:branched-chain amino acid ABC transporter permease [Lachnospiraceae bacterium]